MKLKSKIPLHLREIVLTLKEAIITSGMSRATFFRYRREESFPIPTYKGNITMWVKRRGFPRFSRPRSEDNIQSVKTAKQLRSEGVSAQVIADRMGVHFTTVHKYLRRSN